MDSQDLRQKAMDAVRGGSSIQRAAMRFDVGVTAAGRHQHCRSQWG
jgi:transposase